MPDARKVLSAKCRRQGKSCQRNAEGKESPVEQNAEGKESPTAHKAEGKDGTPPSWKAEGIVINEK